MMNKKYSLLTLAAAGVLFLSGCSSTSKVKNVWVAPEVGTLSFSKILVLVATPDGDLRRSAEAAMKANLPGVEMVAASELIKGNENLKNASVIRTAALNAGIGGIVVMRALGTRTEINYRSNVGYPQAYWSFSTYHRPSFGLSAYYEPGFVTTDTIVGFETNLYEVESGTLIWSGTTRVEGPNRASELIAKTTDAVLSKLREQKLIP